MLHATAPPVKLDRLYSRRGKARMTRQARRSILPIIHTITGNIRYGKYRLTHGFWSVMIATTLRKVAVPRDRRIFSAWTRGETTGLARK
jgi:hypothetical protein